MVFNPCFPDNGIQAAVAIANGIRFGRVLPRTDPSSNLRAFGCRRQPAISLGQALSKASSPPPFESVEAKERARRGGTGVPVRAGRNPDEKERVERAGFSTLQCLGFFWGGRRYCSLAGLAFSLPLGPLGRLAQGFWLCLCSQGMGSLKEEPLRRWGETRFEHDDGGQTRT